MKLSPTVPLALAFAAGIAGAAMAQNSATSGTASTSPQTTAPMSAASPMTGSTTSPGQPSYAQPQQNATQTQPGSGQPVYGQAQTPNNAPNNANEQVRTAQQQLRAAGLYNGPVDGVMDPDTRAALARFQQQNGLQRTESLDQQTLARLQSSQTIGSEPGAPATAPAAPAGSSGNAPQPTSAGGNTPAQLPGQSTQR
jgi:peptidoglycan hydrolase-like protein with peptidoglycan-binding domain